MEYLVITTRTPGLFSAADDGRLEQVLVTMPLWVWRAGEVTARWRITPFTPHPSDRRRRRGG